MFSRKFAKTILPIFLVLTIIWAMFGIAMASEALETAVESETKNDLLPTVGDEETLIKILMERGIIFENITTNMSDGDIIILDIPHPLEIIDDLIPMGYIPDEPEDYSLTNEQVAGVNEGDVVKTDGKFIYALSPYGKLRIVETNGPQLNIASTILIDTYDESTEFYLIGDDRLVIIGLKRVYNSSLPMPNLDVMENSNLSIDNESPLAWYNSRAFTVLHIYDISDRYVPTEIRQISMEGNTISTRVIDDIIYLVTNRKINQISQDRANRSPSIYPYMYDTLISENYCPLPFDSIYYTPDSNDGSYLLVGALDVYGDDPYEPSAYLGFGKDLYMSRNAKYVINDGYKYMLDPVTGANNRTSITDVMRFGIDGTSINYSGAGFAIGYPLNQYSMDEYNGYFRIATTTWFSGSFVTVLNVETMETVGCSEALAPGEEMKSMRFMGDMAYLVTFMETDPLFTIDLSDPYNPTVLGELKIPGFSQYLHPVGDGLLIGIGRDDEERISRDSSGNETVTGFRQVGLKVSLFYVRDPFDPKEIDKISLGWGTAFVSSNPKSLMTDPNRGLYGFLMKNWKDSNFGAFLINVEDEKLNMVVTLDTTFINSKYSYNNHYDYYLYNSYNRLCYIGNYLYLVSERGIIVYDYNTYENLRTLVFY
ncbi:MAG: beta-propeller domain-containing protein [Oscillospiraceae bacterium]|nr:beta-propeller domain-containing protein [Oscillospiraceae bacterium]